MNRQYKQVLEWHLKYGVPVYDTPHTPTPERVKLRADLIREEFAELKEAHEKGDIAHIAKEAADLVYVLYGAALEFGRNGIGLVPLFVGSEKTNVDSCLKRMDRLVNEIFSNVNTFYFIGSLEDYIHSIGLKDNFSHIFNEVHRSNMSKGTNGVPVFREDGKILKGEDFSPANLDFLKVKSKQQ